MVTISRNAYEFLLDAYEDAVETFYDDPFEYADGDPLKQVFRELKELGEELEIDILTLACDDDLERLEQSIKKDEAGITDDDELTYPERVDYEEENRPIPSWEPHGHMSMGATRPGWPSCVPEVHGENNKSVEEKLRKLSAGRQSDEMIGEWTTYEIEEEN